MTDHATPPAAPPDSTVVAAIVANALAEDRAGFDVTTRATVAPDQRGEATILYKQAGVVCGLDVVRETFRQVSPEIEVRASTSDGAWVESGTTVATISGPLGPMLSGERVALNLMQRMSGIATLAREYVEAAIAKLPDDERRVLRVFSTASSMRDAARQLGMAESTYRVKLHEIITRIQPKSDAR